MKRYLIFAGPWCYPNGGWGDFVSAHNTITEVKETIKTLPITDWFEVVDTQTMKEAVYEA